MTKEELISRLEEAKDKGKCDEESAHIDADYALLEFIGDEEVTEIFENIPKWYS